MTLETDNELERKLFRVGWTIDYGYAVINPDDENNRLIPRFANHSAEEEFDIFFQTGNMIKNVGKKVMCECVGRYLGDKPYLEFEIHDARLYSE